MVKKYTLLLFGTLFVCSYMFSMDSENCLFEMEEVNDILAKYQNQDGQYNDPLIKAVKEENYSALNKLVKECKEKTILEDALCLTVNKTCIKLLQKRLVQLNCPDLKEDSHVGNPQIPKNMPQLMNPAMLLAFSCMPNSSCGF